MQRLSIIVMTVSLMLMSSAWAAIGTISELSGAPGEIVREKNKMTGSKGATVESMDVVSTRNGAVNITFRDDTKVKVNENSRLLIDDFVFDPRSSDAGKLAIKVGLGTVRYASGQIAKVNPQQVSIKTPTATISVRGTDFSMTVSETGSSLIILLPSCRDDQRPKRYELEENTCRVGSIEVQTLNGRVLLTQAFQATYVERESDSPTAPQTLSIVESKISNDLIVSKPAEIAEALRQISEKSARDAQQLEQQAKQTAPRVVAGTNSVESAGTSSESTSVASILVSLSSAMRLAAKNIAADVQPCDPYKRICVYWDKEGATQQDRGRGVAVKLSDEHIAEVKTQGYSSNTSLLIQQGDFIGTEFIGSGDPGGNTVLIKQTGGMLRTPR